MFAEIPPALKAHGKPLKNRELFGRVRFLSSVDDRGKVIRVAFVTEQACSFEDFLCGSAYYSKSTRSSLRAFTKVAAISSTDCTLDTGRF